VTHSQGNREGARGKRHLSPVGGLGQATAGKVSHCVLIEAATRGILESKVSGDDWREAKQVSRRESHCGSDVDCSEYEDGEVIDRRSPGKEGIVKGRRRILMSS
jgi:hypothetical protein